MKIFNNYKEKTKNYQRLMALQFSAFHLTVLRVYGKKESLTINKFGNFTSTTCSIGIQNMLPFMVWDAFLPIFCLTKTVLYLEKTFVGLHWKRLWLNMQSRNICLFKYKIHQVMLKLTFFYSQVVSVCLLCSVWQIFWVTRH